MTEYQLKKIRTFQIMVCVFSILVIVLPIMRLFSEYTFKECWESTVKEIKEMMG